MRDSTATEATSRFESDVRALTDQVVDGWLQTPDDTPFLGSKKSRWRQWKCRRAAYALLDELAPQALVLTEEDVRRKSWQVAIRTRIQDFGEQHLEWPRSYRDIERADTLFASATEFIRETRAYDRQLEREQIGQALRNVLIAQGLGLLFRRQDVSSKAINAYSLLYPYTDNVLDDQTLSPSAKAEFGARLGQRLAGKDISSSSALEEKIYHQISTIEACYPRRRFPSVAASLEAIHRAQMASLRLQRRAPNVTQRQLIRISVAKGGTSVLADGYLVSGRLSAAERQFCFGYGAVLQLLDDLQDVEDDSRSGHATIFTETARRGPLDQAASRLFHFLEGIFRAASHQRVDHGVRQLLQNNCRSLLVASIAEVPDRFSWRFRSSLERRWPLRFRDLCRVRRRLEQVTAHAIAARREEPDCRAA